MLFKPVAVFFHKCCCIQIFLLRHHAASQNLQPGGFLTGIFNFLPNGDAGSVFCFQFQPFLPGSAQPSFQLPVLSMDGRHRYSLRCPAHLLPNRFLTDFQRVQLLFGMFNGFFRQFQRFSLILCPLQLVLQPGDLSRRLCHAAAVAPIGSKSAAFGF